MSYMIEGGGSRTCQKAKAWLYKYPEQSAQLLDSIANICIQYLVLQAKHGAQILQVFESHAEFLSPELFRKFCLPVLTKIVDNTKSQLKQDGHPEVPMIIFPKGGHYTIAELSKTNYDVVGLDWTIDPEVARQSIKTAVQGNLDPVALFGSQVCMQKHSVISYITPQIKLLLFSCLLGIYCYERQFNDKEIRQKPPNL